MRAALSAATRVSREAVFIEGDSEGRVALMIGAATKSFSAGV
jgi:hypothetical protein